MGYETDERHRETMALIEQGKRKRAERLPIEWEEVS